MTLATLCTRNSRPSWQPMHHYRKGNCTRPDHVHQLQILQQDLRLHGWHQLMAGTKLHGVPEAYFRIIKDIYTQQESCIKVNNGKTEMFQNGMGVVQRSFLSPLLFNVYTGHITMEAFDAKALRSQIWGTWTTPYSSRIQRKACRVWATESPEHQRKTTFTWM